MKLPLTTGRIVWLVTTAVLAVVTWATLFGPLSTRISENPELLFSLLTVASAVCVLGATIVIALADQRQLAEVGLLGSALMAASVMPLVHALVTPDVLYDQTPAFRTAAYLSLPIAIVVAAPLLTPHSAFGRWAARRWRDWTLLSLLGVFVIGSIVVAFPEAITVPDPRSAFTVALSTALAIAFGSLSLRQLRLYEIGRLPSNMVASLSLLGIAATALLPMVETDYSLGFWWLHMTGVLGVLGACIGLAVSKRMTRSTYDALTPVLTRDPLIAFELGLSPVVHRFVASLDDKDPQTRDHVIRTAETAVRIGERYRMPARQLRDLGLAALLHDVGKLETPSEILDKPGRLTTDEYEVVKQHAVVGEQMLMAESTLVGIAPLVRSHHERMDGRGYPDGLSGTQIPVASRIIAVCDAFDAMTHEHRFRKAMPPGMAFAILREHAGSQWDADVIDQVMAVLPTLSSSTGLDEIGRDDTMLGLTTAADVGELLVAVDAEI